MKSRSTCHAISGKEGGATTSRVAERAVTHNLHVGGERCRENVRPEEGLVDLQFAVRM